VRIDAVEGSSGHIVKVLPEHHLEQTAVLRSYDLTNRFVALAGLVARGVYSVARRALILLSGMAIKLPRRLRAAWLEWGWSVAPPVKPFLSRIHNLRS
jgi:hypothetical protein